MRTAALVSLLLVACAEPDPAELFIGAVVTAAPDEAAASTPFADAIASAEDSLHVALPALDDDAIVSGLVTAWEAGLEVEVVTDADLAGTDGYARLAEAGVPTTLCDNGLTYFEFTQNADVSFTSDMTRLSDVWVVVDRQRVVAANHVGSLAEGTRVVLELKGEDLIDDLLGEHNQLFGGTDATAVDAYDAPNKSITDLRWRYGTPSDADLEMWFGPQERLTKRVIDAVYGARTSIRVLTNDFANDGLAKALQDKAEQGFDVQVVVGPAFGSSSSLLSRVLEDETPDVQKFQVGGELVPTLVLVDWEAQESGLRSRASAMVITHDLYSAARLYRGQPLVTDQLIDGTMWVLSTTKAPSGEMLDLEAVFQDHLDRAEAF